MPKLLLADDSVTIQRVIELTFSGEDMQVVSVGDGEEAIARIATLRPDIILADIGMPKRSGYDVSAFVKGDPDLAHIPVLLLAGAFEPVDQARAEQVKCDGILVKPFEPQQVVARVRELVNSARMRNPRREEPVMSDPRSPIPDPRSRRDHPASRAPEPGFRPLIEIPDVRVGPDSHPPGAAEGSSLDEYFSRLDAAFASFGSGAEAGPPELRVLDEVDGQIPTIDDLVGGVQVQGMPGELPPLAHRVAGPPLDLPDSTSGVTPVPPAPVETTPAGPPWESGRNVIADVFSALLAVEQGDPDAVKRLPGAHAAPRVTDELVDEVTRRVLARLAPDAARGLVAQIVSDVAERLVREEIARIRNKT